MTHLHSHTTPSFAELGVRDEIGAVSSIVLQSLGGFVLVIYLI